MLETDLHSIMHPHKTPFLTDQINKTGSRKRNMNIPVWVGYGNL